jgi:hypothetical protein
MTLTGIFKSILLVVVSVLIWSTPITFLQAIGYTIALAGLTYYSLGYDQLASIGASVAAWTSEFLSTSGGGHVFRSKRIIVVGLSSLVAMIVVLELTMSERGRRILGGSPWHGGRRFSPGHGHHANHSTH